MTQSPGGSRVNPPKQRRQTEPTAETDFEGCRRRCHRLVWRDVV